MDDYSARCAQHLLQAGVRFAFGVTGSGASWSLITALEAAGVRYFPVAHEAAAAIMAGTVSRLTDHPAVSISIKGPGLANMLPGIAHNYFENNPSISVSEAAGNETPAFRRHKRLDHPALLTSLVKACIAANDDRLPMVLQSARQEVPGPVHVDLCARAETVAPMVPADAACDVEPALLAIRRSSRPVLIVGSLACRREWREYCTRLRIPVFTTAAAKGVLDEAAPQSAGVFTGVGKALAPETVLLAEADCVIGIGLRNTEVIAPRAFDRPTILLDEADGMADGFHAAHGCVSTDATIYHRFFDALMEKTWGGDRIDFCRQRLAQALMIADWLPAQCFHQLNAVPFAHALVLDTGAFCTIGEHLWRAGPARPFLGSSNGRYMGVGIPMAVGAALARPEFPVVCAVGDGGMRMYPAEMRVAVQERLPICFLLMSDGRYGSIANVPQATPMSVRAVTIAQPSWWKIVEAMGCPSTRVENAAAFAAALAQWDRRMPCFLEAVFDPAPYGAMTQQLR